MDRHQTPLMESQDAASEFAELFHRVYTAFHTRQSPQAHRPSPETLAMLEHLVRTGPLTVTEAAKHFSRSQSAISELIQRIEDRGWIERFPDERDKRRHLIWLTPEGLSLWKTSTRVLSEDLLREAFTKLTPEQRVAVVEAIGQLLDTSNQGGRNATEVDLP